MIVFYHPDFQMTTHLSDTVMTKDQRKEGIAAVFSDDTFKRKESRCMYENDHILVSHAFITFSNGSSGAVMWIDGLINKVETGSTPVSK